MPGTTWYRNASSTVYHVAAPDWVRTGRATCGAMIGHPGFVYQGTAPRPEVRVCKRCTRPMRFHLVSVSRRADGLGDVRRWWGGASWVDSADRAEVWTHAQHVDPAARELVRYLAGQVPPTVRIHWERVA